MKYLVIMMYQNENGTVIFYDTIGGFANEDDAKYHREYLLTHQYSGREIYIVKAKEV